MQTNLDSLISPEEQAAIRQPIGRARTLPGQAFTSRAIYELEIERIYSRHWVAATYTSDLNQPGDVVVFEVCEMPFIAVYGNDNRIRAFHNICPYDGCPVVLESKTGLGKLVTPYHGWVYTLDGRLESLPFWNGFRDCKEQELNGVSGHLKEVNSQVWQGILFINLSAHCETFEDYIRPVYNRLEEYELDSLAVARDADDKPILTRDIIDTNWKTFCENACLNVLHEAFTHRVYNQSSDVPRVDDEGNKTFQPVHDGALLGFSYDHSALTDTYPDFPCPPLSPEGKQAPKTGYFLTLYPNLYLAVMPTMVEIGIGLPDGPDKTIDMRWYYCHNSAAADPALIKAFDDFADLFAEASEEDSTVVAAIQRARYSPVCRQQFFSPFWDEPHYNFTRLVLDDLTQSEQ